MPTAAAVLVAALAKNPADPVESPPLTNRPVLDPVG